MGGMSSYSFAPQFGKPPAPHALTPEAAAGVASVLAFAGRRRVDRDMARLITSLGHPRSESWEGDALASGAPAVAALGRQAGFDVRVDVEGAWCVVSGLLAEPWCGFRARWHQRRTMGASWHESWRYGVIDDPRTVAVAALTRTGKAGHRSAGMGRRRLTLLGSPHGLPLRLGELSARLEAMIPDMSRPALDSRSAHE